MNSRMRRLETRPLDLTKITENLDDTHGSNAVNNSQGHNNSHSSPSKVDKISEEQIQSPSPSKISSGRREMFLLTPIPNHIVIRRNDFAQKKDKIISQIRATNLLATSKQPPLPRHSDLTSQNQLKIERKKWKV